MAENLPVLATTLEVAAILGKPIPADEEARVTAWLRSASSAVRSYCRQSISFVPGDVVQIKPDTLLSSFDLPELPVVAINSITPIVPSVFPLGFSATDYTFDAGTGQVWLKFGSWATYYPLEVDYDHGNQVIPDMIVDMVASKVASIYTAFSANPDNMQGELIEGYRAFYRQNPNFLLSDEEKKALREAGFRRHTHFSASIR